MTKKFNSVIHADPDGLNTNIGLTAGGDVVGYLSGASVHDPKKCDYVCYQAVIYITFLVKRSADIFPNATISQEVGKRGGGGPSLPH